MSCDKHHAHRTDIHRKSDFVDILASFQTERAKEFDHRFKTVVPHRTVHPHIFVTSDTEHRSERCSISTHNIVINIPSFHPESSSSVHRRPRVRCLEIGQIQKSLIDNGKSVSHLFSGLFADLDREFLLRTDDIRDGELRLQARSWIVDNDRLHTIHTQRLSFSSS